MGHITDLYVNFMQGAFAFKDAMTRGAPLEEEVALIKQAAGGYDELINIALQSLPEDALTKGTKTLLQLEREVNLLYLNGVECGILRSCNIILTVGRVIRST